MQNLKFASLLLVGNMVEKIYFEKYFKEIYLVKSSDEALSYYNQKHPSVIFIDDIDIIKKIREYDRQTIIAILSKNSNKERLWETIPLHLSGYIERPFKEKQVKTLLQNINHDLDFLYECMIRLKDDYLFDTKQQILYNKLHEKVKLTKHEMIFMEILSKTKHNFFSTEDIEESIWEEDSYKQDCKIRLKYLLYGIRKKLPQNSIVNCYGNGYKLVCY